jgi:hypothetical protein
MDSEGKTLVVLGRALSAIWQSPTMSPHCDDEVKYAVANFLRGGLSCESTAFRAPSA